MAGDVVENPVLKYEVVPWNDQVEPSVHREKHKVPRSRVSDPAVTMGAAKEEVGLIDKVDAEVESLEDAGTHLASQHLESVHLF